MSPEQAKGDYTAHSDQYALGVIAFEILAGRKPYQGSEPMEVFQKHQLAPLPDPRTFRPTLSLHTCSVLTRMLSKKPEQRYPTVAEAMEALMTGIDGGPDEHEETMAVES